MMKSTYPAPLATSLVWPAQRLRFGGALVLFSSFEVLIGQTIPPIFAYAGLALGIGALASAWRTIQAMTAAAHALLEDDD